MNTTNIEKINKTERFQHSKVSYRLRKVDPLLGIEPEVELDRGLYRWPRLGRKSKCVDGYLHSAPKVPSTTSCLRPKTRSKSSNGRGFARTKRFRTLGKHTFCPGEHLHAYRSPNCTNSNNVGSSKIDHSATITICRIAIPVDSQNMTNEETDVFDE